MKTIILLDVLNSMFFLFHEKEPDPVFRFISDLREYVVKYKVHKILMCCDKGQSTYRLGIYEEYKQDRRKRRELSTPKEKADLAKFFKQVDEFIQMAPMFGFEVLGFNGVEADDQIAYIAKHIDTTKYKALIMSSDTDLLQNLKKGVAQRSFCKKMSLNKKPLEPFEVITYDKFCAAYGLTPEEYAEAKSFSGDTADSIRSPGGIGETFGHALIKKYGTIEGVEANLDNLDIPRLPQKAKDALKENFSWVYRNKLLIDLHHTPEVEAQIFNTEALAILNSTLGSLAEPPKLDKEAIQEFLFENGKVGLYRNFEEWVEPFTGK